MRISCANAQTRHQTRTMRCASCVLFQWPLMQCTAHRPQVKYIRARESSLIRYTAGKVQHLDAMCKCPCALLCTTRRQTGQDTRESTIGPMRRFALKSKASFRSSPSSFQASRSGAQLAAPFFLQRARGRYKMNKYTTGRPQLQCMCSLEHECKQKAHIVREICLIVDEVSMLGTRATCRPSTGESSRTGVIREELHDIRDLTGIWAGIHRKHENRNRDDSLQ
jgi:hypothetical protein